MIGAVDAVHRLEVHESTRGASPARIDISTAYGCRKRSRRIAQPVAGGQSRRHLAAAVWCLPTVRLSQLGLATCSALLRKRRFDELKVLVPDKLSAPRLHVPSRRHRRRAHARRTATGEQRAPRTFEVQRLQRRVVSSALANTLPDSGPSSSARPPRARVNSADAPTPPHGDGTSRGRRAPPRSATAAPCSSRAPWQTPCRTRPRAGCLRRAPRALASAAPTRPRTPHGDGASSAAHRRGPATARRVRLERLGKRLAGLVPELLPAPRPARSRQQRRRVHAPARRRGEQRGATVEAQRLRRRVRLERLSNTLPDSSAGCLRRADARSRRGAGAPAHRTATGQGGAAHSLSSATAAPCSSSALAGRRTRRWLLRRALRRPAAARPPRAATGRTGRRARRGPAQHRVRLERLAGLVPELVVCRADARSSAAPTRPRTPHGAGERGGAACRGSATAAPCSSRAPWQTPCRTRARFSRAPRRRVNAPTRPPPHGDGANGGGAAHSWGSATAAPCSSRAPWQTPCRTRPRAVAPRRRADRRRRRARTPHGDGASRGGAAAQRLAPC